MKKYLIYNDQGFYNAFFESVEDRALIKIKMLLKEYGQKVLNDRLRDVTYNEETRIDKYLGSIMKYQLWIVSAEYSYSKHIFDIEIKDIEELELDA